MASIRARLRRAGNAAHAKNPRPAAPRSIPEHWAGHTAASARGEYYYLETQYAPDHRHGRIALGALAAQDLPASDLLGFQPRGALGELLFLDTETTGLSGGAGTFAFLVGLGRMQGDRYVLRQYFLRDPAEEAAMLDAVLAELSTAAGLVTFNGRGFDVPILEARGTIRLRRRVSLTDTPHLDLLPHARRFWRGRLDSCSLGTLEEQALGILREARDVESYLIPAMYRAYLEDGEAAPLEDVIYHNACDILSMVALTADLFERYRRPPEDPLEALDGLALARMRGARPRRSRPSAHCVRRSVARWTARACSMRTGCLRHCSSTAGAAPSRRTLARPGTRWRRGCDALRRVGQVLRVGSARSGLGAALGAVRRARRAAAAVVAAHGTAQGDRTSRGAARRNESDG
jgi:uncharacterized protein YprB with RNaseH-like and TPR domain